MNTQPHNEHTAWRRFLFFLKFLEIRLRFVLILVITALVVGYWDNIQNHYERWQRHRQTAATPGAHSHADEAQPHGDHEFFCPMHPFVVRDRPGKCPICGMDLVQRKRGAAQELPPGVLARVQVSPERVMQAGVQVEPVSYRLLTRTVRSYGVIEPDETRISRIVARFPGRIDQLMVAAVGLSVKQGEPLARIYSPKFLAAAEEYAQAIKASRRVGADAQASPEEKRRTQQLAEFARQRLRLAGFTDAQLDAIAQGGKASDTVTLYSPLAGTVLEKNSLLGDTVEEGSTLFTIADLSHLWIQALIAESDLTAVQQGMPVEVTTVSRPGEIFYGTVDFVYPTVNTDNRSVKARVKVENPSGKLKPGMYVTAVLRAPIGRWGEAAALKDVAAADATQSPKTQAPTPSVNPSTSITLPTQTQADADRYLKSLPAGAEYYTCPMDPEVVSDKPGDCPKCGMHLEKQTKPAAQAHEGHAIKNQDPHEMAPMPMDATPGQTAASANARWAEGYACPMHPDQLVDQPGLCAVCNCGMKMKKLLVERVPSVPESAVIDTGARKIVYVESLPGVYDAREVTLGPRAAQYYPVLAGLNLGDRIAARGSFLIDAEARLNPSAASAPTASAEPKPAPHQHGG